jgi:hypothetical protein
MSLNWQFRKQRYDLSFNDALQDRIRFEKRKVEKRTGEDQFAAYVRKGHWAAKDPAMFRNVRKGCEYIQTSAADLHPRAVRV